MRDSKLILLSEPLDGLSETLRLFVSFLYSFIYPKLLPYYFPITLAVALQYEIPLLSHPFLAI